MASVVATAERRYVFQGREVTLPVAVRNAASAAATYLVPSAAARRLLPGPELDAVELLPGRALFSVACIDYRDHDLGDYNEVALALFVRERGAPIGVPYVGTLIDFVRNRVATRNWKLPVNQSFRGGTRHLGFPQERRDDRVRGQAGRRSCRLVTGGRHVLTFSAPRASSRTRRW